MKNDSVQKFIAAGQRTVQMERDALCSLADHINAEFARACDLLLQCSGRVVVSGVGKSGHIAHKIAATLSSTGTPALFVHAAEAGHGDMGMVTERDVVVAISHSGAAQELLLLVPFWKRMHLPLIAITGSPSSPLVEAADVHLDTRVRSEACPLGLAPTTSTTATLVIGDALAVALLEARGFSAEDFAFSHPSGVLGRNLLLKVCDVMDTSRTLPKVSLNASLAEALQEMSAGGVGITTVVDAEDVLQGVFSDGDLRRTMLRRVDPEQTPIRDLMTVGGHCISPGQLAAEALNLMEEHKISALVCVDSATHPLAIVHLHNLIRAGLA